VAIELTHLGEQKIEDSTLEASIRSDLSLSPDYPVFVPARVYHKGHKTIVIHLMQGYVFVASGLPEPAYFELEKRPYVNQVMSIPGGPYQIRTLSVIPNSHVEALRQKLRIQVSSDIQIGDGVEVVDGPYKTLMGKVVGNEGETAYVEVTLRSLNLIASIPFVFLEADAMGNPNV
jgi:transcription antitermination factor NusG